MSVLDKINKYLSEGEGHGEEYKAFFNKMLKKYNVSSPDELSEEERKKFFKEVEDEWKKEDPKTNDKDENTKIKRIESYLNK